jgi:hypothetical protein
MSRMQETDRAGQTPGKTIVPPDSEPSASLIECSAHQIGVLMVCTGAVVSFASAVSRS